MKQSESENPDLATMHEWAGPKDMNAVADEDDNEDEQEDDNTAVEEDDNTAVEQCRRSTTL